MKVRQLLPYAALTLVVAQLLLLVVSWLLSATLASGVRSLISSEGIRWFFGHFTSMLCSPLLAWMLLMAIAWGCLRRSGLLGALVRIPSRSLLFRERVALRQCAIILTVLLVVVVLLTAVPHAVLLSASGLLFPSAFSASLIAIVCFFVVVLSLTYALLAGVARSMADVFELLVCGIRQWAPLFVIYILFIQFYESLRFVFW